MATTTKTTTTKTTKASSKASPKRRGSTAFTSEERAAMREHAAEARVGAGAQARELVQAKIAEMPEEDRVLAEAVQAVVEAVAPHLEPRTWYGMPAWSKDGKVLCFFQPASKFKARYATLGFNDPAALDDGPMWPVTFALTSADDAVRARLTELVRRASA